MIRHSEVCGQPVAVGAQPARGPGAAARFALGCWLMAGCTDPVYGGNDRGADDASEQTDAELDAAVEEDATIDGLPDARGEEEARTDAAASEAGTSDAAAADIDASKGDAGVGDRDAADTGTTDGSAGADAKQPMTQTFPIAADEDDAVWYVHPDFDDFRELLHFVPPEHMSSGFTIEVGADGAQARAGLRFRLPMAPGARVLAATLALKRMPPDENLPTDTMRVQVFDADDVPAFAGTHYHVRPDDHAASGLWGVSVGNFAVGKAGDTITSPDLSILVQHVVDRPGWRGGAYLGFVLFPELLGDGFAPLGDSFAAQGASLSVTWREP
jgi:hypothetical protein